MSQAEPTPDSRKIVEDLEDDIVDVEGARSRDEAAREGPEGPERPEGTDGSGDGAPDGNRAVPGSPEPPD
jgi:hypothetical protein